MMNRHDRRDGTGRPFLIRGARFGNELSRRQEDAPLPDAAPPEQLRRQVLKIAASAGSDEARTREWISQRYGCPLEELEGRPLLHALAALSRGVERRNGSHAA